jgi:hypothetical protein
MSTRPFLAAEAVTAATDQKKTQNVSADDMWLALCPQAYDPLEWDLSCWPGDGFESSLHTRRLGIVDSCLAVKAKIFPVRADGKLRDPPAGDAGVVFGAGGLYLFDDGAGDGGLAGIPLASDLDGFLYVIDSPAGRTFAPATHTCYGLHPAWPGLDADEKDGRAVDGASVFLRRRPSSGRPIQTAV